jgi:hypothetical protein
MAFQGQWHGMSMLFPMERFFERFVEASMRRVLPKAARIKTQAREPHLCQHNDAGFFQLTPDIVVEHDGERVILDTKWKRLNAGARAKKYGMTQGDFYQLVAYGHKYIPSGQKHKELVLIYPKTTTFDAPLPPFTFSPGMRLWVLPFETGDFAGEERLILLPKCEWRSSLAIEAARSIAVGERHLPSRVERTRTKSPWHLPLRRFSLAGARPAHRWDARKQWVAGQMFRFTGILALLLNSWPKKFP